MKDAEDLAESPPLGEASKRLPRSQASLTVEKGIRILECFDVGHPEWSLKDISARTGVARPTVYRLVKPMIDAKYLTRDIRTGNYHLGPGLLKIAYLMGSHSELVRVAHPCMEELAAETNESVALGIWRDKDALLADVVVASRPFVPTFTTGSIVPGYSSVHGQLFLAFKWNGSGPMPWDEIEPYTERTTVDPAELDEMLLQVKREGVAFSLQQWKMGMCAVGAPIFSPDNTLVADLVIVAPEERFGPAEMREYAAAVKRTAAKLSQRLGYQYPC